jgi:anthranilate phosphoribosyltransferase
VGVLAEALAQLGSECVLVVHGSDGLDEITITGATHAALLERGAVREFAIDPRAYGIALAGTDALRGGDAAENAAIALSILEGEPGPRRDVVLLNAAGVLWVAGAARDLGEGLALARESLDSGAARAKLAALVQAAQAARSEPKASEGHQVGKTPK